jgi:predicted nucleic acid-binding protein
MVDTMVFDALDADPPAWQAVLDAVREGELLLCTTHVQEDQLAAIPDPARRKALQRLPRQVVPAAGGVAGVFRTGRVRYTDDAAGDALRFGSRHSQDDLIADAAIVQADVLVTEDRRLIAATRERGLAVWQTAELVAWAAGRRLRRHD